MVVDPGLAYLKAKVTGGDLFQVLCLVNDQDIVVRYKSASGCQVGHQQRVVHDYQVCRGGPVAGRPQEADSIESAAIRGSLSRYPVPRPRRPAVGQVDLRTVPRRGVS